MDNVPPDDGLKWFGEGFDGFPKRLPSDSVEYLIYAIDKQLHEVSALRARLKDINKSINELVKKHLQGYIWQRDDFRLKLYPEPASQTVPEGLLPHLKGRTNFGDSINDEWLIVYLLLETSRSHPNAWITINDADGEFLLIEAANAIPKWLNPDIAGNRVWINNGHLRIIPLDESASRTRLSIQDALSYIQNTPEKLIISPFVEDEAFYRMRDYPDAIPSNFHNALITIPRILAHILHRSPAYISPAVEAFYLRDPVSLKPLATKDLSTLLFAPEDFVTTSVKFTKVGYAQLKSQPFDVPPSWTGSIPRLHDPKNDIGMKVTCGFEMLLGDPQSQDKRVVREMKLLIEDVNNEEERLPTEAEVDSWPKTQDDEKWLDIDYRDFEAELSGKKKGAYAGEAAGQGFGDASAQENLRKMVSRFEDFLNDDKADMEGVNLDEDEDKYDQGIDSSDEDDDGEDKGGSYDEAEFEKAMKEMMGMPPEEIEKSGLLDEARRLAIEDAEGDDEGMTEDEEMRKVMELMERELKGHGALNLSETAIRGHGKDKEKGKGKEKAVFGPEPPPGMRDALVNGKGKVVDNEDEDEDVGPGDGELSSDDEEYNNIDLDLAQNMLESFKGQVGMAGPAGNLMRALGVNMPRDEVDN